MEKLMEISQKHAYVCLFFIFILFY